MRILFFAFCIGFLFAACGEADKKNQKENKTENQSGDTAVYNPAAGLPDGENIERYPNGSVKTKGNVIDGKRHGQWISYYQNGTKWSEMNYSYGVREGKTVSYHENGMIRYIGYYYGDEKSGKWSFYDETGGLVKEEEYKEK